MLVYKKIFLKYRLLDLLTWAVVVFFWMQYYSPEAPSEILWRFSGIATVFFIIPFYTGFYYLVPSVLDKKGLQWFFLITCLFVLVLALLRSIAFAFLGEVFIPKDPGRFTRSVMASAFHISYIVTFACLAKIYLERKQAQKELKQLKENVNHGDDHFFIKADRRIEKIFFDDIIYVEAMENYSIIYTSTQKYMVLQSLKNLERVLSDENFMRVHKSYIIAVNKITSMKNNAAIMGDYSIPLGREKRGRLMEAWASLQH
jgi:cell division protein FtsL